MTFGSVGLVRALVRYTGVAAYGYIPLDVRIVDFGKPLTNGVAGMNFVIGVSGLRGAGKSTFAKALAGRLRAPMLLFDDYAYLPPSLPPDDVAEWIAAGADPTWPVPALVADLEALKAGHSIRSKAGEVLNPASVIIIEDPLGRLWQTLGGLLDFVVYVDTPHHVALARSFLRELLDDDPEGGANALRRRHIKWLKGYVRAHETLIRLEGDLRAQADLILDGLKPTEQLVEQFEAQFFHWLTERKGQTAGEP